MISVCVPTRGRAKNVVRLLESIFSTSTNTEVVFYFDDDDTETIEELKKLLSGRIDILKHNPRIKTIRGPRIVMSDMWNKCAEQATGDILMLCGDDAVFGTDGWDKLVEAKFAEYPDRIVLVYGDDKVHGEGMATHPFIHRNWVNAIGRFTPPYFSCDWPDTWLFDVAKTIGRIQYLPDVVTEHLHPVVGKAEYDRTHNERMARGDRDNVNAIYSRMLDERQEEAKTLLSVIERHGATL